jgi:hypothetical protein
MTDDSAQAKWSALVHYVDAVSSAVGDGEAQPEGHHNKRDNPQEVESEPKPTGSYTNSGNVLLEPKI